MNPLSARYHIETIGCQMNVYDSERMADQVESLGYQRSDSVEAADLIIMNTCAIREKAEQKVFSYLGRLAPLKRGHPERIIAVGGCVAQQEGERILSRMPHVDLVFGTHAIRNLAQHIETIHKKKRRIVDVAMDGTSILDAPKSASAPSDTPTRFVTIMQGCDNFCTYCVVPHVRGPEASRHPDDILQEIKDLVRSGVREVTLLGQNVNSYGIKEGTCSFAELLHHVEGVDGLQRIRFTTSHPKDISDELIRCFSELDKLCGHIHLPVQSGSDRTLKRMNRKYTRQDYLRIVDKLRFTRPDIAITSDFIVGFPGETEADFQDTLDLIEHVQLDGMFAFKYSDRPSAPASRFSEKISETVKKQRLQVVLKTQEKITRQKHEALVGTRQEILVEGFSKATNVEDLTGPRTETPWTGRTPQNKIVHFLNRNGDGPELAISAGKLVWIYIERAFSHSLWGRPVEHELDMASAKGDCSDAA